METPDFEKSRGFLESRDMVFLKPKKKVVLVIIFSFLIGFGVPFLIFNQVSSNESLSELDVRSWIKILFPTFFLFAAGRVLFLLKTIEIDQTFWRVRFIFPRREVVFSIADIESIEKLDYVSYKYRIPITTYKIRLKNSKRIKISSNEISDFEKLNRILNKKEYKPLKKQNHGM